MVEKKSREAFAEYDETQCQPNIKLERGLRLGWGLGGRRGCQGWEREKF